MFIILCHVSGVNSSISTTDPSNAPAKCTKQFMPPSNHSSICLIFSSVSFIEVTSIKCDMKFAFKDFNFSDTSFNPSEFISTIDKFAPCLANSRADALPMPVAAPVTKIFFLERSNFIFDSSPI